MTPPPDELTGDADPADDAFAQLLADWDENISSGNGTAVVEKPDETPGDGSLHSRLEKAQACLKLLNQVWPRPASSRRSSSGQRRHQGRTYARFGRYEIVRELGRGGHGVVFLATDPVLKRHVALKLPRPEVLASEELRQRFMREAEAAARLDHPNILPIFEVGMEGPVCFTAAAYCDGGTLQDWQALGNRSLASREAAQIVAELAGAVHHAHTRGVLHRDLKPSNVLLLSRDRDESSRRGPGPGIAEGSDSTVPEVTRRHTGPLLDRWVLKISDFGLAKVVGGEQDSTMNGVIMGTANYMAPEQATGRTADIGVTTDVYALGVILYELLTGAPPFRAETNLATLKRVEEGEAAWPSKVRAKVPADLRTVCLQCLEKDPARRYGSAAALAADLQHFLRGEPVSARSQGPLERTKRLVQRHPALAVLSIMAACLAIGFVLQLFWHNRVLTRLNATLAQKIEDHKKSTADAQRLQHIAETRAEENRRRNYGANLRLAQQYGDAGFLRQLTESLQDAMPEPDVKDLREFAWLYWWNRCRRGEYFVLPGHGTFVNDAAYSVDGRLIATCSGDTSMHGDATVRIWDSVTGRQVARLRGLLESAEKVAFSPSGKLLAAGDRHGTVKIWSTDNWQVRQALATHGGAVRGLCFVDDQRLVTGGDDAAIRLWDVASGEVVDYHPLSNSRKLTALAVSPAKNVLLAGNNKGDIQIRALSNIKTLLHTLEGHECDISSLAVSLQGDRVFSCDVKGNLRLWNLDSRTTVFKSQQNLYRNSPLAISADGRRLAAVTEDARVQVLDAGTDNVLFERKLDMSSVGGLGFSPSGDAVLVAGSDGKVALWHPFAQRPQPPQGHSKEVWSIAFSKDGRTFVSGSDDLSVAEWETATGRRIRTVGEMQPGTVAAVAYSPDGSLLATTNLEEIDLDPENVRLWQMPEGKLIRKMAGHNSKAFSAAFHPGGQVLATGAKEVILWDVKTGLKIDQLNDSLLSNKKVKSIAFSRDGSQLAFASEDKHVYVYEFPSLKRRHALASEVEVWCVAFSPDGESLAAGNRDGDVTIFDPHTGSVRTRLRGHLLGVRCVAFTSDGQTVATGSEDDTIKLWGPVTGQEFCTLSGHAADVYCLAFSPDDQWLASGSYDGAIRLWHAPRPTRLGPEKLPSVKETANGGPTTR
jgi:WD40 repeat protein/serine/threonine protein kinase